MSSNSHHGSRHYDTIVLGAGISGLAAASRLFANSEYQAKNRLLVLEARDRIGGRIGAVHVNGSRLDTGANWIHGIGTEEEPNPLVKILPHKKFQPLSRIVTFKPPEHHRNAPNERDDDEWELVEATKPLRTSGDDESLVIPAKTAGKLMGSLWSMIGSLGGTASQTPADKAKNITMLQAITTSDVFQETYRDLPEEHHRTFGALPQFIENMEAAPLVPQSAEHTADSSGFSLLEFAIDDFDGDQVFLRDGYIAIVNEVAKHLIAADIIKTGIEVEQIRYDRDLIEIDTNNGIYTAKEVICSLPLGVLQHHQNSLTSKAAVTSFFQPPLPEEKAEAVASLGFGTLDKIFLVYDDAWWTKGPYTSIWEKGMVQPFEAADQDSGELIESAESPDSIIGFTDELAGVEIYQDGRTSSGLRVLSVINLHNLTGFPVLSAFVSCANATQVEALSDEKASGIVHRALTSWLGREPPKPDAVHVTRWAQDEYSRGSYSHMITGKSETKHREVFQQPIFNGKGAVLRFAGEHTSRNHFATVHGALLSGWREADAILEKVSQ